MAPGLHARLRDLLLDRRVAVVVGAGVSIAATGRDPVASWPGLLEHGVEHARGLEILTEDEARGLREQIREGRDGEPEPLIVAATELIRRLGGQGDARFARWLAESVGALRAERRDVLEGLDALRRVGAPLTTTNYDDLLCEATGLPPVPWTATGRIQKILRGEDEGILHLHGHWREPESVILGLSSYDKVAGEGHPEALEQVAAALESVLFVGCGANLDDPNFRPLREWLGQRFQGSEHVHFRLATKAEAKDAACQHEDERIAVLEYGDEHDALGPYLKELAEEVAAKRAA